MKTVSRSRNYSTTKQKKINKRRRIKIWAVLVFLLLLIFALIILSGIISQPITNIYISGNEYLTDQQVIEIAKIGNYPSTVKNLSIAIEKRLENDILIKKAKVRKKWFTKVYIEVTENRPLLFNSSSNETVLLDGSVTSKKLECPTLVNYVPDTIYDKFIAAMQQANAGVLKMTSEIMYSPDDYEDKFLFIMDDGNYVYLNLTRFNSINNYISIVKKIGSKKGILHLDDGEYFEILDN